MAEAVYLMCTVTSLGAAMLLLRSYRKQRTSLLMWSTLCFIGLAINNVLLLVDLVIVPDPAVVDLSWARTGTALLSVMLMLIGLLWEDS
jgi:hypothetical protein